MKKNMKKAMALAFAMVMVATTSPVKAEGTTATLPIKSADIALGTRGVYYYESTKKSTTSSSMAIVTGKQYSKGTYKIPIKKAVKGAKYVCTTSNKKIVTANVKDNRIYLTGLQGGKATITCKQTLEGKTTVVGKIAVTVHNAKIKYGTDGIWSNIPYRGPGAMTQVYAVTKDEKGQIVYNFSQNAGEWGGFYVDWSSADKDVKYSINVDKPGLKVGIKDTRIDPSDADGKKRRYLNTIPSKPGTYTVTLTEEYKNKKVKTTAKNTYYDTTVNKTAKITKGEVTQYEWWLQNFSDAHDYKLEGDGFDITKKTSPICTIEEDGYVQVKGNKKGTYKVKVYYYDAQKKVKGKYLGTCKVTVE